MSECRGARHESPWEQAAEPAELTALGVMEMVEMAASIERRYLGSQAVGVHPIIRILTLL